jgi:methyl-accepting chemotaxis protein
MKRKTTAVLAAILAALFLTGCETNLKNINVAGFGSITLDLFDGWGPKPYSGGLLPEPKSGNVKPYIFEVPFTLGENLPDRSLSLIIGPTYYPYTLSINGQTLHSYGGYGFNSAKRMWQSTLISLPPGLLSATNHLKVTAYVSRERTPLMGLAIADSVSAGSYVFWRNFFTSQLLSAAFCVGILLFLYFMLLFFLGKRKDRQLLWFSLVSLTFALGVLKIVFSYAAAEEVLLTKVSSIGYLFCISFLLFYVQEKSQVFAKARWLKPAILGLDAVVAFFVGVQSSLWDSYNAYHIVINFIISPQMALTILVLAIAIYRQGWKKYVNLSVMMAISLAASLYDTGFENLETMPYAWLVPYAFLVLVLFVFVELIIQQAKVTVMAQEQSKAIAKKNETLKTILLSIQNDSQTLSASTEQLSVSTREISVTSNQQAASVREMVSTMEDANALIQRISVSSSQVHAVSETTAENAERGAKNVRDALNKLEAVISRISESITLIADFNDKLSSITEVVRLIEGIATQIRIIAFNASLEAVAAGDAGKNFKIVAEEVKRLADSTMSSVKVIREKVNSLISTSENVVKTSRQGYMALEQSWDIASGIGDSFGGITASAEDSAKATADIDLSIREESTAFEQIVTTLKEISSAVNSFVTSSAQTAETTSHLKDIAERLHGIILTYSGEFSEQEGYESVDKADSKA